VRAQSESVLSLRSGLKAVLGRLGRVPRKLLTDHSSTAAHQLGRDGKRRGFNEEDLAICAHCGLEPRVINVGRPEENGNCESAHGHLKRRIKQNGTVNLLDSSAVRTRLTDEPRFWSRKRRAQKGACI